MTNPNETPSITDALAVLETEPTSIPVVEASEVGTPPATTFTQADMDAAMTKLEDDWKARYGGLDAKLTATLTETETLRTQVATRTEEATRAKEDTLIKRTEDDGGDVDLVKTIVERDRTSRAEATRLATDRTKLDRDMAIVNEAGRVKKANDLVKEFGLEEKVLEDLLAADSPAKMEILALRAAQTKAAGDSIPVTPVDGGQSKGGGVDISKLTIEQRMQLALEGKI